MDSINVEFESMPHCFFFMPTSRHWNSENSGNGWQTSALLPEPFHQRFEKEVYMTKTAFVSLESSMEAHTWTKSYSPSWIEEHITLSLFGHLSSSSLSKSCRRYHWNPLSSPRTQGDISGTIRWCRGDVHMCLRSHEDQRNKRCKIEVQHTMVQQSIFRLMMSTKSTRTRDYDGA